MSLSAWEQQALDSIRDVLAGTDPELATLLATFSELATGEEMPAAERIMPGPHLAAWLALRRRRRPSRGRMYRRRRQLGQVLTARWAVPVLWLAISISLISMAVALSGGPSQGPCPQSWSTACITSVPSHTSQSVTHSTMTGQGRPDGEPVRSDPAGVARQVAGSQDGRHPGVSRQGLADGGEDRRLRRGAPGTCRRPHAHCTSCRSSWVVSARACGTSMT